MKGTYRRKIGPGLEEIVECGMEPPEPSDLFPKMKRPIQWTIRDMLGWTMILALLLGFFRRPLLLINWPEWWHALYSPFYAYHWLFNIHWPWEYEVINVSPAYIPLVLIGVIFFLISIAAIIAITITLFEIITGRKIIPRDKDPATDARNTAEPRISPYSTCIHCGQNPWKL